MPLPPSKHEKTTWLMYALPFETSKVNLIYICSPIETWKDNFIYVCSPLKHEKKNLIYVCPPPWNIKSQHDLCMLPLETLRDNLIYVCSPLKHEDNLIYVYSPLETSKDNLIYVYFPLETSKDNLIYVCFPLETSKDHLIYICPPPLETWKINLINALCVKRWLFSMSLSASCMQGCAVLPWAFKNITLTDLVMLKNHASQSGLAINWLPWQPISYVSYWLSTYHGYMLSSIRLT